MNCRKCNKHLSAWLDGELPRALADELSAHLSSCPACAERRRQLEALNGAVARLESPQASPGFDAAFSRRLLQARRQAAEATAPRRRWLFPLVAAAASACIVVAVVVLLRGHDGSRQSAPAGTPGELVLAQNLDLLRDYGVVAQLDALEDPEVVMQLHDLLPSEEVTP